MEIAELVLYKNPENGTYHFCMDDELIFLESISYENKLQALSALVNNCLQFKTVEPAARWEYEKQGNRICFSCVHSDGLSLVCYDCCRNYVDEFVKK